MKNRRKLGLVAASALLFSGGANAVTMGSGVGHVQSFEFGWNETIDGAVIDATVIFTLASFTQATATVAGTAVFNVTVENNSSGAGANRLVSFGIDTVTPDLRRASINDLDGELDWTATLNTNMPGGFGQIDLCIWEGQNCAGGSNGGLLEDDSDTFRLTLRGAFTSAGGITFTEPYIGRFQSVGVGDDSCTLGGPPGGSVPEPGPLALLGVGLAALAMRRRRQAA